MSFQANAMMVLVAFLVPHALTLATTGRSKVRVQGPANLIWKNKKAQSECLQKDHLQEAVEAVLKKDVNSPSPDAITGCPPVHFIDPPRTRNDLGELLGNVGLHGIGVEVGVKRGFYMKSLMEGWKRASLYVQVDLWEHQENYDDIANVNNSTHLSFMREACDIGMDMKSKGYVNDIIQCKDFSTECVKFFPDASLDFVYIDARHDRLGVLEDLKAYWPKVKRGGVIAGHDYVEQFEVDKVSGEKNPQDWTINYDGSRDATGRVVKGAVNDFFSGNAQYSPQDLRACPRQPVICYRESVFNTWIVRK